MSEAKAKEIETEANNGEVTTSEGVRTRKVFMMKHFIPSQDFVNKEIVAKGKGTKMMLGRVWGVCTDTDERINTFPDGRTATSIVLKGIFEAESYLTGEIDDATTIYLPAAYAERIKTIFATDKDARAIKVDVDLGLEATGKTIPYEWVVMAYSEGEEMALLKKMRSARKRPDNAPKLQKSSTLALENKSK